MSTGTGAQVKYTQEGKNSIAGGNIKVVQVVFVMKEGEGGVYKTELVKWRR